MAEINITLQDLSRFLTHWNIISEKLHNGVKSCLFCLKPNHLSLKLSLTVSSSYQKLVLFNLAKICSDDITRRISRYSIYTQVIVINRWITAVLRVYNLPWHRFVGNVKLLSLLCLQTNYMWTRLLLFLFYFHIGIFSIWYFKFQITSGETRWVYKLL